MEATKKALKLSVVSALLLVFLPISVSADSCPRIFKLSRFKGEVGRTIEIKGRDFGSNPGQIKFGDVSSHIRSWGRKKIKFEVPDVEVSQTYRIRVCRDSGPCSKSIKFFVTRTGPEMFRITNLTRGDFYQGVPGDTLKITGINLKSRNIRVLFGNTEVNPVRRESKSLRVVIPEIARNLTVSVKITDGVNFSNAQDFFIKP